MKPRALILSGYGLNCEEETRFAFARAGARADIVHVNDLISRKARLSAYEILAIPGGFSFGDDLGSGRAYANRLKNHLSEELRAFTERDTLTIGICNGFQILTNAGLLPGALIANDTPRYLDRWVDLKIASESPWLRGVEKLMVPIAHGEGKFFADRKTIDSLERRGSVAARYVRGEICAYQHLAPNPNGSMRDIAAITAYNGRMLGMMPHPERAMFFTQLPHWTYLKERLAREGKPVIEEGPGLKIFKNAVAYFM